MKKQAIIVLSGGITPQGRLPFFVKNSLNEAYKLFHQGVSERIIVSGKWSYLYELEPKTTEAAAAAKYLNTIGVSEKKLLLEERSQDLISSAYYLKKLILLPRRLKNILIITSDFQEERVKFVFNKILGGDFTITYHLVASALTPQLLWEFFTYERHLLHQTQAFLRKIKKGDHHFLKDKLFKALFYKKGYPGRIHQLVSQGKIGKPSGIRNHYSLPVIYKKREEIFAKYGISAKGHKSLKADFWSGKYLNFVGWDSQKTYYAAKFALVPKHKQAFKKEILLIELLRNQAFKYIPTIIDKNFSKAPIWYLYKVIPGSISGKFSINFSFKPRFYKDFARRKFVLNLKKMRQCDLSAINLKTFNAAVYKRRFRQIVKKISEDKDLSPKKVIQRAEDFFYKGADLLNSVSFYPSHCDLHPGNIIISSKKRSLYFIDFEHATYNNIAFDFCFGYLFSWDNSNFQKELLKDFLNSLTQYQIEEFNKIFPYIYCFFLLWLLEFTTHWRERSGKERYQQVKDHLLSELRLLLKTTNNYSTMV